MAKAPKLDDEQRAGFESAAAASLKPVFVPAAKIDSQDSRCRASSAANVSVTMSGRCRRPVDAQRCETAAELNAQARARNDRDARDAREDGIHFVELAPVFDDADVVRESASAVGVVEQAGHELIASLGSRASGKKALLVIDNSEQMLPGRTALVERLLATCHR